MLGFSFSAFYKFLPSLVTLSALCCGVSSIRFAVIGEFPMCVIMLVLAAIFDGLDGHVARLLNATSQFGAELDSLCDLVDFGVSPCLVMYLWAHRSPSPYIPDTALWLACLWFCTCCALRLARFNVSNSLAPKVTAAATEETPRRRRAKDEGVVVESPTTMRHRLHPRKAFRRFSHHVANKSQQIIDNYVTRQKFFRGIPAPAGGALSLLPMIYDFQFGETRGVDPRVAVVGTLFLVGFFMISTVPSLSSKMLMRNPRTESHLKSRSLTSLLLKIILVASVIVAAYLFPWLFALLVAVIYIMLLPLGPVVYHFCDQ